MARMRQKPLHPKTVRIFRHLRMVRLRKGLSIREVSEASGIPISTLRRIEKAESDTKAERVVTIILAMREPVVKFFREVEALANRKKPGAALGSRKRANRRR
jgi:transcriptional regulator with XRE-family HTH domain